MNIILIGMPGAGKSTLGVILAKTLGMDFVDTDIVIQQQEGRLLQSILDDVGLKKFLEIEEGHILSLRCTNTVIATGGSAVYSDKAMRALKSDGFTVYIHLPFEEIEKRLLNVKTRGVAKRKEQTLKEVYEERLPLYYKYADLAEDCSGTDIEQSLNRVVTALKRAKIIK